MADFLSVLFEGQLKSGLACRSSHQRSDEKRKKISRVKSMAEIAAEIMVWEGYEVTGPIDQKLKSLLSMIQVPG